MLTESIEDKKIKRREYVRLWKLKNKEKVKDMQNRYIFKHIEKVKEYRANYYEKNKEKYKTLIRERYKKDPEYFKSIIRKHRNAHPDKYKEQCRANYLKLKSDLSRGIRTKEWYESKGLPIPKRCDILYSRLNSRLYYQKYKDNLDFILRRRERNKNYILSLSAEKLELRRKQKSDAYYKRKEKVKNKS